MLQKTEIARRQLGTALALFLEDYDPVSAHTLACAGCELAAHLTRKAGKEPFAAHVMAIFPDFDIKRIRRVQNQYWNTFKHATTLNGQEREDQELLERFSDSVNDHTLFVGWYDYGRATGAMPIEAQVFTVWYFALYSEKLDPKIDLTPYHQLFTRLSTMGRADQKAALRAVIATYREDREIMTDPATDPTPLILLNEAP